MSSTNITSNAPGPSNFPSFWGSYIGNISRCLAVLNVPSQFSLLDTMRYFRVAGLEGGWQGIRRIVRTVEAGENIYWVGFSSRQTALIFRGHLAHRYIPGFPPFIIEFVHGDVYSARSSWARESWSRKAGLTLTHSEPSTFNPGASYIQGDQPSPSATFFETPNADDERLFAELGDPITQRYQSNTPSQYLHMACQSVASNDLLYRRLETTTPPDDDTILTRCQRRDRERRREQDSEAHL